MAYASLIVEGGLFPSDLLDRIATGDAEGQRAADFGIDGSRRLADEIQSAFSDARSFWDAFQRRLQRSRESKTTLTREDWMVPFLELLGFERLVFQRASPEAGGETFFISHRAGEDPAAPPVHIAAAEEDLDRRSGTGRRSPHAVVQEYLNRSDALWGITTNGRRLRLLRDTARLAKPTYLEFDLDGMVEGNQYSDFVLLYRLIHASRFPRDGVRPDECLLEHYYQQGIDEGGRVRDKLRDGVEEALRMLGTAFLSHPDSGTLRDRVASGGLDAQSYYRQLLRLVYRFLFLMVAEERRLIFPPQEAGARRQSVYTRYYGVSRLRERCERYFAGDSNGDLWLSLRETFRLFRDNEAAKKLGLSALDGELFGPHACEELEGARCTNEALLTAIRHLSMFEEDAPGRGRRSRGPRRRVNYAGLDVEEFGSVYESLLDFHPQVTLDPPAFDLVTGSERKQTGSYYTPPELVRELIESALVPVMEERLSKAKSKDEKEDALLGMRVCDPAAGSGHFLLAAARRIARELAKVRTGEEEPTPEAYREALRDVIRHCIYAVDKNPLAVDLCKVALWIEGHNAGLPLSFLDHHVKCGDSLIGVFDIDVLQRGIPDDAYKPVTGDDKAVASSYRKQNKQEREGQLRLDVGELPDAAAELAPEFAVLAVQAERTPDDVHAKEELYEELRGRGGQWWKYKVACDLWASAFFTPLRPADGSQPSLVPTTDTVRRFLAQPDAAHGQVIGHAVGLSQEYRFFHWPLEFPEVFAQGGFDVALGNPPWDQLQFREQEFFSRSQPDIAQASTGAARKQMIRALAKDAPALHAAYDTARYAADATRRFVQYSGRFPLNGRGRINTYGLFAESCRNLLSRSGLVGCILPTGIATDDSTKLFFQGAMMSGSLVSLYDFENRAGLFPAVDSRMKFCLLTLASPGKPVARSAQFVFFAHRMEDLRETDRRFTLTADQIALLNPNTQTCPIFRTRRDVEIAKSVYERVPILIREEAPDGNQWGIITKPGLFNMAGDSACFRTRTQLRSDGWLLHGNVFIRGDERYLPLYEGKMFDFYDHRAACVVISESAAIRQGQAEALTTEQHQNPWVVPIPRYWVPQAQVEGRLRGQWDHAWIFGWKEVTSGTNERTLIPAIFPRVGIGHKIPIALPTPKHAPDTPLLAACLSSILVDFIARQKLGGTSLTPFTFKQLPAMPPSAYEATSPFAGGCTLREWLACHVLELYYVAWDMQPLASDLGYYGSPFRWDEERRFLLRWELDAAFFHLYGIEREDVDYIMETFPIVRRRDEERYDEYRTKRVVLDIYDAMAEAMRTGEPYQTLLDPPPADPRVAHAAMEGISP